MTDKQIIIDGIDVSECEAYKDKHCKDKTSIMFCSTNLCSNFPNCYYKQLKRSEAQCEGMFVSHTDLEKKYKAKEQECERLKNELSTYGATGICETCTEKSVLKCDQLEEENRSLKKQLQFEFDETLLQYSNTIEDLQKQLNNTVMQKCPQCGEIYLNPIGAKLYEALTEIKEIAENAAKCLYTTESDDYTDGYRWLGSLILQKIRKCEVENERILSEE